MRKETLEYLRTHNLGGVPANMPNEVRADYESALMEGAEREFERARGSEIFKNYIFKNKNTKLWAYQLYSVKAPDTGINISNDEEKILNAALYVMESNGIAVSPETVYKGVAENKFDDFIGDILQIVNLRVVYIDRSHAITTFGAIFDGYGEEADYLERTYVHQFEAHCVRIEGEYIDLTEK